MRWRRRRWPEREPRPEVRTLSDDEKKNHRRPTIVEGNQERTRVLMRFGAMSSSGESFGGTCLYACRDGNWGAYQIKPSESRDITSAEAWLVKRKWRQWGR
jgi:hypothetical protein